MKRIHKFVAIIAAMTLCSSILCSCGGRKEEIDYSSLSAVNFSKEMGVGWNLGNTFDAYSNGKGCETGWGNPEVNEKLIKKVKKAGFDTIRIPVSYMGNIGDDGFIDEQWLNRVYEVVQMAIDNDLFVIINIHHDGNNDSSNGAWIDITQEDQTEMQDKFENVWNQIAEKFKDCPDTLIFESMNEIHDGTYTAPSGSDGQFYYDSINALNQIFVNTVRKTGGNNSERFLLVPGYNTNIDYTIDGLRLPNDTADDKLMVSVHYYDPYNFTLEENMNIVNWGNDEDGTCGYGNEDYVEQQFDKLRDTYIANGIPVILGEYGAVDKDNDDARAKYLSYVTAAACERGIVPVYWDNGYDGDYGFALFNRESGKQIYPDLVDAIVNHNSK